MNTPEWQATGDRVRVWWPDYEIAFDELRQSSDGLHGEVWVRTTADPLTGKQGHIHWARLNLSSTLGRKTLATYLAGRVNGTKWADLVEAACTIAAREQKRAPDVVRMSDETEKRYVEYLIPKLLPLHQTTILYGRGGGAKGWFAIGIAVAIAAGIPFPGFGQPRQLLPCLYLDWEADKDETRRRIGWVCRGLGLKGIPENLYYIKLTRSLEASAPDIRDVIASRQIGYLTVDSLVPATEADPLDSQPARATMEVMRSFDGTTRLVVGHMTKSESRLLKGEQSLFGSVFYENLARSMWQFRCRDRSEAGVTIALTHTKANMGVQFRSLGFRLKWDDVNATAAFSSVDVATDPYLAGDLPLRERALHALRGGQMTIDALAEELDEGVDPVRAELNRMRKLNLVTNRASARGGRGVQGLWELPSDRTDTGRNTEQY